MLKVKMIFGPEYQSKWVFNEPPSIDRHTRYVENKLMRMNSRNKIVQSLNVIVVDDDFFLCSIYIYFIIMKQIMLLRKKVWRCNVKYLKTYRWFSIFRMYQQFFFVVAVLYLLSTRYFIWFFCFNFVFIIIVVVVVSSISIFCVSFTSVSMCRFFFYCISFLLLMMHQIENDCKFYFFYFFYQKIIGFRYWICFWCFCLCKDL